MVPSNESLLGQPTTREHELGAQAAAQGGVTAPPDLNEPVELHFVALVEKGGR